MLREIQNVPPAIEIRNPVATKAILEEEAVRAAAADQEVAARAAFQTVGAAIATQRIRAVSAVEAIIAAATDQPVVPPSDAFFSTIRVFAPFSAAEMAAARPAGYASGIRTSGSEPMSAAQTTDHMTAAVPHAAAIA